MKTILTPKNGEPSRLPVPASTIAGATAGVCSTLTMYPLELLKTRLTVEVRHQTPDVTCGSVSLYITYLFIYYDY